MSQSSTIHFFALAALFVFLFVCPATVAAIPINQYQENLTRAIATLETLQDLADNESYDYEQQRTVMLEFVRTTLPKQQTVEFEGEVCNVDNSWLHQGFDEIEKTTEPSEKLGQIIWRLRAIKERVAERQSPDERTAENKEWAKTRL